LGNSTFDYFDWLKVLNKHMGYPGQFIPYAPF
jgi:hypothetical protein